MPDSKPATPGAAATVTADRAGNRAGALILGATLFIFTGPAGAQSVDIPLTWGGTFLDRPRLTGDWFGLRDEMGKKGIVLDLDLLQFPQGVMSGGRDTVAEYSGLAEYTLNVNSQKLGLWPAGFLNAMGMTTFGDNVNNASGALIPPNVISLLPEVIGNTSALMNLSFMQFLSPKYGIVVGKLAIEKKGSSWRLRSPGVEKWAVAVSPAAGRWPEGE